MSEVNQAFLRAYLKNRALPNSPASTAPAPTDTRTPQDPNVARPAASIPRKPSVPPTQPSQTLPAGMHLRFDPSHAAPNPSAQPQQTESLPFPPSSPAQSPARVSPRQGVWSALGVERGMKALESTSVPAVVRNGVTAVTSEATRYRQKSTEPISPQAAATKTATPVQRPLPVAPPVNVSYDQVMYVDGLAGHASPHRHSGSQPTERALAKIAEPIAFGTGAPADNQPNQTTANPAAAKPAGRSTESFTNDPVAQPVTRRATIPKAPQSPPTEARQPIATVLTSDGNVARRLDSSHQKHNAGSQPIAATARTKTPPELSAELPLPVAFSPSWEVDQFFWPEVVKQIESSHSEAFREIGKHLSLANRDGLKVMAITSGERGVGRTTVAMHMARCAASAGLRVALLDGDTFCPSLVDQLRLDVQQGWQDCLFENVPLHDIAVHSIADRITFFPLTSVVSQQQVHANLHRMAKLIRRISNAYDMVFIDASRLNLEQRDLVGVSQETVVDAVIVVVDTELSIKEKVDSAVSILQGMGIASIGLVENFQS